REPRTPIVGDDEAILGTVDASRKRPKLSGGLLEHGTQTRAEQLGPDAEMPEPSPQKRELRLREIDNVGCNQEIPRLQGPVERATGAVGEDLACSGLLKNPCDAAMDGVVNRVHRPSMREDIENSPGF